MLVTFNFASGPREGSSYTVEWPGVDPSTLADDTATLDVPDTVDFAAAVGHNVVRLVVEDVPLASVPHRITRYRNRGGAWHYVPAF